MKQNKILISAGTILMLIISVSFMGKSGYKVGDEATDFKLKNVDGNMLSMSDYSDAKGVILVFTCNTCPFSNLYERRIIALDNKFRKVGYPVVAINPNDPIQKPYDSFEQMVKVAERMKYPFPYLVDETQEVTRAYGATNTPQVYVLEKKKEKFYVRYIGAIDNDSQNAEKATKKYVEDAVHALIKGKNVKLTSTKAIGCTIKWK